MPKFKYFLWNGIKIINSMIANGTIAENKLTSEVQEKINSGGKDRSFEYVETLPETGNEDTYYLTKATRPTVNYGDYCSNKVLYPTANLPSFSSIVANKQFGILLYNSNNGTFYLYTAHNSYGSLGDNSRLFISNGSLTYYGQSQFRYTLYKYEPSTDTNWVKLGEATHGYAGESQALCIVSSVNKFKFLLIVGSVTQMNYVAGETTYPITATSGIENSIYADFFETTGDYKQNDLDNVDESNIYLFNMNVYRNSSWSVVGTFDLQDILELFAKITDVNSALALKLNANQGSENAGKFLKVASDGSIEYATIS